MLSNEKYIGNVRLLNSGNNEVHYLAEGCIPSIIIEEIFNDVQNEKIIRSNVIKSKDGNKRKSKKYTSKKIKADKK